MFYKFEGKADHEYEYIFNKNYKLFFSDKG